MLQVDSILNEYLKGVNHFSAITFVMSNKQLKRIITLFFLRSVYYVLLILCSLDCKSRKDEKYKNKLKIK